MELKVNMPPSFAIEATKLANSRADDLLGSLTIKEAEMLVKTWLYEAILENQEPVEKSLIYFTRTQAAKKLDVAPVTLDSWVENGVLNCRWIGNRRIFLSEDLQSAIRDENIYNSKK